MKKTDNSDLINLQIKINCTNEIAYMDCALLLDKPEFLRLLPSLRKKHDITELISYKKFYAWTTKKLDEDIEAIKKDKMKGTTVDDLSELDLPFRQFENDTKDLCRRFKKPGYFVSIIQFAIVCGVVGDISYEHTRMEISPTDPSLDELPLPEVRMVITPMTTLKNMQDVFEKNVPGIFEGNIKLLKYYYKMKNRKSVNFQRDREWYWRNFAGEGYTEIALSETSPSVRLQYETNQNRYSIPEYEMIKQSIRRYKNLLKVYI